MASAEDAAGCGRSRRRRDDAGRRATTIPAARAAPARCRAAAPTTPRSTAPSAPSSDEVIEADELCDADELSRLRHLLDQQLSHLQSVIARLANRLQRQLLAKQTRAWEFDLDEGLLDAARLVAGGRQPGPAARLQARARDRFPRHRRHPADRQFGLDARPADHRRGDERRHPRAHPRALRASRSRSSALPPARGRAARRASAGSPPASRPTRAGSTICATSSTSRPTRRGGAPGATSG